MSSSWVQYDADHPFPVQNLPYGVFQRPGQAPRCATAIGDSVVDLYELSDAGFFDGAVRDALRQPTLNAFMGLGRPHWLAARQVLQRLLAPTDGTIRDSASLRARVMASKDDVQMKLPADIGDYTDFYSSREHATNVGKLFRPGQPPLLPNWLHLPVGYHGRSSSIVVSGTPVRRPVGQQRPDDNKPPTFGPCKLLDMELEMGAFVGPGTTMGEQITMERAKDHIFGLALFNDWSARDIQKWEYVPLGPFLAKNFASTLSPWVVTLEALDPFFCDGPPQTEPTPMPYLKLRDGMKGAVDITLSASVVPPGGKAATQVSQTNFKYMYWSVYQQLVHHTVNGCNVKPGDLFASGTISGPDKSSCGSMLEITWRGANPIKLQGGGERKFFQDGDSVRLGGHCQGQGYRIGFGPCEGTILPAPAVAKM